VDELAASGVRAHVAAVDQAEGAAQPQGQGRAARYDEQHVLKARAAQHLRRAKLSLPAIRARLAALDEQQLRALAPAAPRPTTPDGVPLPPSPPSYPRLTWEVVTLMDGLILLVGVRRGALLQRIAGDIYRHYCTAASSGGCTSTSARQVIVLDDTSIGVDEFCSRTDAST
jgi:hypothetical protein